MSDLDNYQTTEKKEEVISVELPTYEGPLYMLLELARAKKIDMNEINVLSIADQFLEWFHNQQSIQLELAADWLVMAATLTLIKSRLLIPVPKEEKDAANAFVEDLAARLRRLDAIRSVADELNARKRLGVHWHKTQDATALKGADKRVDANLHSLLLAYVKEARLSLLPQEAPVRRPYIVLTVKDAISYLTSPGVLIPEWTPINKLVPPSENVDRIHARSKLAASYVASLEMAKRGMVEIRQAGIVVEVKSSYVND